MPRLPPLPLAPWLAVMWLAALWLTGCGGPPPGKVLTFSGSGVGAEAELLERQLRRFEAEHPGLTVNRHPAPDAADHRHQLYVQWLNAGAAEPDVLQLDVIWTPEFAAAGWLLPLTPEAGEGFFPALLEAARFQQKLYALPWFVDAGMLYYRTDLIPTPPRTFAELVQQAREAQARHGIKYGLVLQGARYEGLACVFLELLGGFGGSLLTPGGQVAVDQPPAVAALTALREALRQGVVPEAALTFQEEQARFAFQNGQAVFMRNWPYAYPLLQDRTQSAVAGKVAVAPMPASEGGTPTAAMGGSQLAANARTRYPEEARALVAFLTAPRQMEERARYLGQFPTRRELYQGPAAEVLPLPAAQALAVVERATPRPVTPVYSQLSEALQIRLHAVLTGQQEPAPALADAAAAMRQVLARAGLSGEPAVTQKPSLLGWLLALAGLIGWVAWALWRRERQVYPPGDVRLAAGLTLPAAGLLVLVGLVPLGWTAWESLHAHDLRLPWQGRPFVGLGNYAELAESPRFRWALLRTLGFTAVSVSLELLLGLALALGLNGAMRGRGLLRAAALLPWALPTVVAGLVWRFLFDSQAGAAGALLSRVGLVPEGFVWFTHPLAAWVPVVLADVWKTTPFVALLLLAGLQGIDGSLYEAARVDGASAWRQFRHITLPLLRPALVVALIFRTLDAVRVFDLIYVLTGGGPGSATEPLSLLAFQALLAELRFGLGAALSMTVLMVTGLLALLVTRLWGQDLSGRAG